MKIDKKTIDTLCRMNDDTLWNTLRLFASSRGIILSKRKAEKNEMARIRNTLSSLTEADVTRITELVKAYNGVRR